MSDEQAERDAVARVAKAFERRYALRWLNADELTQPGTYLWKRGPIIVAKPYEVWPIWIGSLEGPELQIMIMGGVPMGPVKGAPGRFFGPIPNDDPGAG